MIAFGRAPGGAVRSPATPRSPAPPRACGPSRARGPSRHGRVLAFALALVLQAGLLFAQASASDSWPSARGGTGQTGAVAGRVPAGAKILWRYEGGDEFASTPVSDGKILVACDLSGAVHCLDPAAGKLLWKRELKQGIEAPALIEGDRVYVCTARGELRALARGSGKDIWTWRVPSKDPASAAGKISGGANPAGKGALLLGSYDRRAYCVGADGKTRWSLETGGFVNGSVATDGVRAYVAGCDAKLRCVEVATGKLLWVREAASYVPSNAALAGGRLYALAYEGELLCLDAATGKLLYRADLRDVPATIATAPALSDEGVVVAAKDGTVLFQGLLRGERLWRTKPGAAIPGSPLVAGGEAWTLDREGWLRALDLGTGKVAREIDLKAEATAGPCAAAGRIYAGLADGSLVCVGGAR